MRKFLISLVVVSSLAASAAVTPSAAAKSAFEKGEKALEAQKYDEAVAAYQEALKATPNYAAALNGLGSALFKQKKADEAIAQFKAATAADPSFKLAWFNLGYATRKTQDFATAATAYEKYTALDPNDPDGFYGLGESYKQLGQNEKAIKAYETYLTKEKRPSEQKWIDRAKESIAQLKAAPPAAAAAPVAAAAAPAAAAAASNPPPAAAPPPTGAMAPAAAQKMAEGDKLWAEKKYREASFAYQDAVNADPNNVEALFKLGNAYAVLGYYSQAIDRWAKVQQVSPDPAVRKSAADNIARAQQKMAQAGGATPQEANKPPGSGPVADSTRTQARQHYESGVQLIGQRRYGEALASLNECLRLEPALTVGYIARGSTLIGLRRFAEAAVDYQYALKLDPSLSSPLYGLAEAYRGMNRVDDARGYYQKYVASTAPDVRPELQTDARTKLDSLR
ncbi:MAG: tetratricopeptide repeat protein [Myxococcota bacterium]